jgi:MFS family permease
MRASHAIGLAYGIAGLGNAAEPLFGGLLTGTPGWRWIFWLKVPLALVSLAIGASSINESSDESVPWSIDIADLPWSCSESACSRWHFTARRPGAGPRRRRRSRSCSLATLIVIVVVENKVRWPLVGLLLVRNARFTILVLAGTLLAVA